jgi:NADH-quinone oxidoreductase subunit L
VIAYARLSAPDPGIGLCPCRLGFGRAIGERVSGISVGFSLAIFVLALGLFIEQIALGQGQLATLGGISLFSLYFDSLTALMALAVSAISLIVHLYSMRYMRDDPAYTRFFVLLDCHQRHDHADGAGRRSADLAAGLAFHRHHPLLPAQSRHPSRSGESLRLLDAHHASHRRPAPDGGRGAALLQLRHPEHSRPLRCDRGRSRRTSVFGLPITETVGVLVLLAAFAKSAQFPFHTWLPYTMDGPTPVSALMHAGIVNSGGFLINRFAPVFVQTDSVLQIALLIGLTTTIMGSVMMLMQSDIKKALGYSTMGQMGYMVMECGLGAFSLAIFHLIAHGVFKATLFLAPAV